MSRKSARNGGANNPNHVSDIIRKSRERWAHGRIMENARHRLADAYLNEGLWIAVKIHRHWPKYSFFACLHRKRDFREGDPASSEGGSNADERDDRKKEAMFVGVGEFVQCGERRVPSVVRFYLIHDEVSKRLGDGPLFQSVVNGRYQIIPCIPDWEVHLTGVFRFGHGRHTTVVKRGPEVGDRIAENEADLWAKRFACELDRPESGVWIRLDMNGGVVSGELGSLKFKVADVMLGPFNLKPSGRIPIVSHTEAG